MAWENKVYNIYKRVFKNYEYDKNTLSPINLKKLCATLNITLIPYDNKSELNYISVDGFSKMKNNKFYIFFNKNKHQHRIKFTIAHEIGHILLNHFNDISTIIANSGIDEQKEWEANMFARLLLAPPKITTKLKDEEIAEKLNISKEMAKIVSKMKYKDYHYLYE